MNGYSENITEYDFSALDEVSTKKFSFSEVFKEISFFLLPISSFLLFLLILLFAIVPTMQEMNKNNTEIIELNGQASNLATRISNIQDLGQNIEQTKLIVDTINEVVPTGKTEVVKFGEKILSSISQHNLANSNLRTGESLLIVGDNIIKDVAELKTAEKNNKTMLPLSEIPTRFDVHGDFENIRSFFSSLYKSSDFFIVNKMDLNRSNDNLWFGEISLVKYQFSPSAEFDTIKAYKSISENSKMNPKVVDFLNKKYIGDAFIDTKKEDNTDKVELSKEI